MRLTFGIFLLLFGTVVTLATTVMFLYVALYFYALYSDIPPYPEGMTISKSILIVSLWFLGLFSLKMSNLCLEDKNKRLAKSTGK